MTQPDRSPDDAETARTIVRELEEGWSMFSAHRAAFPGMYDGTPEAELIEDITAALAEARRQEREACAKIADDYSRHMTDSAIERGAQGKPHLVADSKSDAGLSIAQAIRKSASHIPSRSVEG